MQILIVYGTRPEAIKMAPVVKAIEQTEGLSGVVCSTGQHGEMLEQVNALFDIRPNFDLQVMREGQGLTHITTSVLEGLENVLGEVKPDLVLVHGDTTTSTAAALASFYAGIPVGHVEAGLRTYNLLSPWPEEANRQLTGRLASLHFAPTQKAADNLIAEGTAPRTVAVTGNTVIDALLSMVERLETDEKLQLQLDREFSMLQKTRKMILVTGHRRESFGDGFDDICLSLATIARNFPDVDIVYPVHLNPNVLKPVTEMLSQIDNIYLLEPQRYLAFVYLMSKSTIILTDSGGVQEEAPSLGKPVLVMRNTSERMEAIEAGTVRLVGTNPEEIIKNVTLLLEDDAFYKRMSESHNPYGDGLASSRIVKAILSYLK